MVMWDRRSVELIEHYVEKYLVSCHFKNVDDGIEWTFSWVYGPNLDSEMSFLCDGIICIHSWLDIPWYLGGDYNVTRFSYERGEGSS